MTGTGPTACREPPGARSAEVLQVATEGEPVGRVTVVTLLGFHTTRRVWVAVVKAQVYVPLLARVHPAG